MRVSYSKVLFFSLILAAPSVLFADSGAMYDAWENGEQLLEDQSSSLLTGSFYFSMDGEETAPPPPPKAKWGRFKSLEEQGAIPSRAAGSNTNTQIIPDGYDIYKSDPFSDRINDIESLLSQ